MFLTTHYMEEAAEADYVVVIDGAYRREGHAELARRVRERPSEAVSVGRGRVARAPRRDERAV